MAGLPVSTLDLLREVQTALYDAERHGDTELLAAAESVLSALIVVLRYPRAELPDALGPHIAVLIRRSRGA